MKARRIYQLLFVSLVMLPQLELWARPGGGGHDFRLGPRSHPGSGDQGFLLVLLAGAFMAFRWWFQNYRINRKSSEESVKPISRIDSLWREPELQAFVRTTFMRLQRAWSDQDLDTLKKRLHPDFYGTWLAKLNEYALGSTVNRIKNVTIHEVRIVDVKNFKAIENDTFTACIDASGTDLFVTRGKIKNDDRSAFREFWTFTRQSDKWLLREVSQEDDWRQLIDAPIVDDDSSKRAA